MYDPAKIEVLVNRLYRACSRLPDLGGDLWARGIDKIHRKYGCSIWLSRFEPADLTEEQFTEGDDTITVETEEQP